MLHALFRFVFRLTTRFMVCASLYICVAACAMWARSYLVADSIACCTPLGCGEYASSKGYLQLEPGSWPFYVPITGGFIIPNTDSRPNFAWKAKSYSDQESRDILFEPSGHDGGRSVSFAGFHIQDQLEYYSTCCSLEVTSGTWETLDVFIVLVPYWQIVLVTSILPSWWLLTRGRRTRRHRTMRGLCGTCGYDLRGGRGGPCCVSRVRPNAVNAAKKHSIINPPRPASLL